MSAANMTYISFGVQAGDKEANTVVAPFYMRLRKLLEENCSRGYGQKFKELAFVLRIDGSIWHWEKTGCDNLRARKNGQATIDIFMPLGIWRGGDGSRIRMFLADEATKGFFLMVEKLSSLGVPFEKENLVKDFCSAIEAFNS